MAKAAFSQTNVLSEEQNQCHWTDLHSFKKPWLTGHTEVNLFAQRCLPQLYKQWIPFKALPSKIFLCNKLILQKNSYINTNLSPAAKPEVFSHRSVFAREIAFGVDKLNSLSTLISVSMCHSWSHSTAPAVLSVKLLCFRTQAGKGGTGRTCGLTKTSQILSCKRTRHHHKTFSVREDIIGRGFFPPRCKLQ